ncbi:hypothetical protein [Streptomyces sp. NPDC052701]|uniref:hypothetical protein n=1 Tax=Streptomyces sp. NPDC052701 TaxID=3155533 RepID=UPI00344A8281
MPTAGPRTAFGAGTGSPAVAEPGTGIPSAAGPRHPVAARAGPTTAVGATAATGAMTATGGDIGNPATARARVRAGGGTLPVAEAGPGALLAVTA